MNDISDVKSMNQMILNLRTIDWFELSACKRLLINIINI